MVHSGEKIPGRRFADQVAIIAGGARGIGLASALRIAREGAKVVCLDISESDIAHSSELKQSLALGLEFLKVDVSKEAEVKATFSEIAASHGTPSILVNCAGAIGETSVPIIDTDTDVFLNTISTNLIGAYFLTKHCLPLMLRHNYGRILHITSIGGKEGNPGMSGYAASKAGLMGLVKGVGKEYARTGITINGLAPAVISTPMNAATEPDMLDYMTSKIPMGRMGTLDEAASLICWIVSAEASFNTGFIFDLSGGRATY